MSKPPPTKGRSALELLIRAKESEADETPESLNWKLVEVSTRLGLYKDEDRIIDASHEWPPHWPPGLCKCCSHVRGNYQFFGQRDGTYSCHREHQSNMHTNQPYWHCPCCKARDRRDPLYPYYICWNVKKWLGVPDPPIVKRWREMHEKIKSTEMIIDALKELVELDEEQLTKLQAEITAEFYAIILPPPSKRKKVASKAPVTVYRTPPFVLSSKLATMHPSGRGWGTYITEFVDLGLGPYNPRPQSYCNQPPTPKRSLIVELNADSKMEVDWPYEGAMYGRQKALKYIKKTTKGTKERAQLIQFMVEWRFVPSEGALYDLISTYENNPTAPIDAWKKRGRPKKIL